MTSGRHLLERLPPFARFALLAGVVIAVVAAGIVASQQAVEKKQAVAESEATVAARLASARLPVLASVDAKLSAGQARALARAVKPIVSDRESSVQLWSRQGSVVFSTARRPGGSQPSPPPALRAALAGKVASAEVGPGAGGSPVGSGGKQLATFVPYSASARGRARGALEVRRPLSAAVAARGGLDGPLLTIGTLALAWAALVAIAALLMRGSRARDVVTDGDQVDPLTGLTNRTHFREALKQAIAAEKRHKGHVAVLLMDLDRFKEVNDTLGHFNGDLLLKRIGPRLRSVLRDEDTVARLGGDEFAILIPGLSDAEAATAAARRVASTFEEPFVLGGLSLSLESSVGIALYPDHGDRVDVLIHRADTAMYTAKSGGAAFTVYSDEQEQGSRRRLALAGDLRRAISKKEIVVHYQPKALMASGEVLGVEALARWQHPERGTILPGEFIPIAEQTNQLHALTEQVLEQSLRQVSAWHKQGLALTVSVNLSMRNLLDAGLPDQLERLLRQCGAEPAWLELELTESMIMSDPRRAHDVLGRLKAIGVGLSVDDFGTGYSSLTYLKDLPVDRIKIDKSFVIGMDGDARNAAIVRATVDLGHNLGLEVVAEGVETQAAHDELAALGCDYAQGYLLAEPMPAPELAARVRELEHERSSDAIGAVPPALVAVPGEEQVA